MAPVKDGTGVPPVLPPRGTDPDGLDKGKDALRAWLEDRKHSMEFKKDRTETLRSARSSRASLHAQELDVATSLSTEQAQRPDGESVGKENKDDEEAVVLAEVFASVDRSGKGEVDLDDVEDYMEDRNHAKILFETAGYDMSARLNADEFGHLLRKSGTLRHLMAQRAGAPAKAALAGGGESDSEADSARSSMVANPRRRVGMKSEEETDEDPVVASDMGRRGRGVGTADGSQEPTIEELKKMVAALRRENEVLKQADRERRASEGGGGGVAAQGAPPTPMTPRTRKHVTTLREENEQLKSTLTFVMKHTPSLPDKVKERINKTPLGASFGNNFGDKRGGHGKARDAANKIKIRMSSLDEHFARRYARPSRYGGVKAHEAWRCAASWANQWRTGARYGKRVGYTSVKGSTGGTSDAWLRASGQMPVGQAAKGAPKKSSSGQLTIVAVGKGKKVVEEKVNKSGKGSAEGHPTATRGAWTKTASTWQRGQEAWGRRQKASEPVFKARWSGRYRCSWQSVEQPASG